MVRAIRPLPPELTDIVFNAGDRRIVLLEGDSDRAVFSQWFRDRQDILYFHTVGSMRNVQDLLPEALKISHKRQIYGIIDRDYRSDEEARLWRSESEPHLFILCFHELENYLLVPKALAYEIATIRAGEDGLPTAMEIEEKILELGMILLSITAANALCSDAKVKQFDKGMPLDRIDRTLLLPSVAKLLGLSEFDTDQQLIAKENQFRPLLLSLSELHTCIEGKRLLHHLHQIYVNKIPVPILVNLLARAIRDVTGIPEEIREIIEQYVLGLK